MRLTKLSKNENVVFNDEVFSIEEIGENSFALVNHTLGLALTSWASREAARQYPDTYLATRKTIRAAIERYDKAFGGVK